ncbi:MAG: hypothetical protein A3E78_09700 [Alphaproteobacteria bacterium RIFCSPHIGHO2_12_FULL_63_12]|nr:MAG: hypothetical protein A3E78_09700 [Alphaproteobacteria bacterium RIFCSPHIGHO2_12_FULL_63_12]
MAQPIRAYLLLRSHIGDWSVVVCRDWEAVMAAWSAARQTAILHVGFDRPPTPAFELVAATRPGRFLVTAAAKFGLPAGFETSDKPIGHVEGIPVYLGSKGWGYTLSAGELISSNGQNTASHHAPSGWVEEFLQLQPALAEALAQADIYDEESYQTHESALPAECRHCLGSFRFRSLVKGNDDDPCAMATAAPPWIWEISLNDLSMPVRALNAFTHVGIKTIADLAATTSSDLMRIPNFGRKSLKEVAGALVAAVEAGPSNATSMMARAGANTLLAEVRSALATLDDRAADVLMRRMGLGCTPETLQTIADAYNLTRERIRQIEVRAVQRLIKECYWDDLLEVKLDALLKNRHFPLPLLGIEAVDAWFGGVASLPNAVRYILDNFCNGRVALVRILGVEYLGFLTEDEWKRALREARRALSMGSVDAWTREHCRATVMTLIPERAAEFRELLWEQAAVLCHFSEGSDSDAILLSYGRGAEQVVEAVLHDADAPLHYTEIARRVGERGSREIDIRRVHNAAAEVGILLGPGTYGVEKHLAVSEDVAEAIRDEAERLMGAGLNGRQWHTAEIRLSLLGSGTIDDSVNKYVIDYLLRDVAGLRRLGRMTWAAASMEDDVARIDIRQAIIRILEDSGRPLSASMIRQRLVALRGVNAPVQIPSVDPIIRLGRGIWGLNDRDIPLKRARQPAFLAALIDLLRAAARGLHVSEIEDLGQGLPAAAAVSIATQDVRFSLDDAQFLYLSEWSDARRETLLQVTGRIAKSRTEGWLLSEIQQEVSAQQNRPVSIDEMACALKTLSAAYDQAKGLWKLDDSSSEDAVAAVTDPSRIP